MDHHEKLLSISLFSFKNILAWYPCFPFFLGGGDGPMKNYFLMHLLWLL